MRLYRSRDKTVWRGFSLRRPNPLFYFCSIAPICQAGVPTKRKTAAEAVPQIAGDAVDFVSEASVARKPATSATRRSLGRRLQKKDLRRVNEIRRTTSKS